MTSEDLIEIQTQSGKIEGKLLSVEGSKLLALMCRGLTGDLTRRLSVDDLADALAAKGWSSIRFDYRGRGNSAQADDLPTVGSMMQDITSVVAYAERSLAKKPDVVIGQALGCRLALECLSDDPTIPLIMWAPIIWFQTSAEIRYRMHEYRREGFMAFDGATIGQDFLRSAIDPNDAEFRRWIHRDRRHIIVHGAEDRVVPMRLVVEMRGLIEEAGGRFKLFVVGVSIRTRGLLYRPRLRKSSNVLEGYGNSSTGPNIIARFSSTSHLQRHHVITFLYIFRYRTITITPCVVGTGVPGELTYANR